MAQGKPRTHVVCFCPTPTSASWCLGRHAVPQHRQQAARCPPMGKKRFRLPASCEEYWTRAQGSKESPPGVWANFSRSKFLSRWFSTFSSQRSLTRGLLQEFVSACTFTAQGSIKMRTQLPSARTHTPAVQVGRWAAGLAWSRGTGVVTHSKALVDQGLQCDHNVGITLGHRRLLSTFFGTSPG